MKRIYLLPLLIFLCIQCISGQVITFDDQGHTPGQALSNPYNITNNGETFSFTLSGGVATNHIYRTIENSCGSAGMSHIYSGNFPQTTWTIATTSGNQIELGTISFDNVFSCFSFEYSLTIEGFKDNASTGTQAFTVPGLNSIFTPNSNFDDVDKIVITASDLGQLGIDNINWALSSLPVELVSFSAIQEKDLLNLKWTTASELNNEKFQIEVSQDGQKFEKIGEQKGKGTTSELQNYSFTLENPHRGVSYYRLKQIDFDGQFEYSKVISIDFKEANDKVGKFYPNPSKSGLISLDYFAQSEEDILISVFDITGKLVINQIRQIATGNNSLSFNFSEITSGIYFVKIGKEKNPTYRKLIIEK